MQKGTVLSVDDDQNLQIVVGQYLESDGYHFITAYNVESALETVDRSRADVILLDLVLPDGEGLSLISQFRAKTNAPIIIVSGKSDTTEKIICLEMGADDYITKPFEMRELSARIKAVMRRGENVNDNVEDQSSSDNTIISFEKGWRLDRSQYQLFNPQGESRELTTGEFKLLDALVSAPNRVLSRERLFELTRDSEYDSYDRAIDIQIGRLRKKLDDGEDSKDIIKTVRGIGYMFCGQLD